MKKIISFCCLNILLFTITTSHVVSRSHRGHVAVSANEDKVIWSSEGVNDIP